MADGSVRSVFVIGASGSGTTMLAGLIASHEHAVGLAGNHVDPERIGPDWAAANERVSDITMRLWDRTLPIEGRIEAERDLDAFVADAAGQAQRDGITCLAYKRSSPFMVGDRYRPDVRDLARFGADVSVIAMYRDPLASCVSAFRRGHFETVRAAAVVASECLTNLSAQLGAFDPSRLLLLPYEALCAEPMAWVGRLAEACALPEGEMAELVSAAGMKPASGTRYREMLSTEEASWLEGFFDDARRRCWPLLSEAAGAAASSAG